MVSSDRLTSLEKRVAIALSAVFGLRMLGLFMLLPVLAIYGPSLTGFSPLWLGLAIGAYGLTQAVLQIPMGLLSDRIGRKRVIIGGLLVFCLGSILAALSDSIYGVTAGRALQGMGAIAAAILALAADLTRETQRQKVMAMIGANIGLAFAVAMVLGPAVAASAGLSGLFWLIAILALVGMFVMAFSVPSSIQKAPKGETIAVPAMIKHAFLHPQLRRLNLGVFCLHFMLTAIFIMVPKLLVDSGIESSSHWLIYLPVFLLSFVLMVPMMIIGAKKGKESFFFQSAISMLITTLGILVFFHNDFTVLVPALLIFFVAFNYLEASMPAIVSRIAPAGQKGTAMGVFSSGQFLGAFAGGATGGILVQQFSNQVLFAVTAGLGLIWWIIAQGMKMPARSERITIETRVIHADEADSLAHQLSQLEGVMEAIVVLEEKRTYLKVDASQFNMQAAQAIVN